VAKVVVLRPDEPAPQVARLSLAERRPLAEQPIIGLVANGKPLARELLEALADEIRARVGRAVELIVIRKPSAAYPITDGEANLLAARAHMVITGLGD
jgi:hypothetical protein